KEADIEPYYTHIRHGRKPSPEALQDLKDRYQASGGISPLAHITDSQGEHLRDKLNASQDKYEFVLYIGLKHIDPFIEDAVEQMNLDGINIAVSIVLAPHYSTFSVNSYNGRAQVEAEKYGIELVSVDSWYAEDGFINYWPREINKTYEEMSESEREYAVLIISAHSLPEKILVDADPYVEQLEETSELISEATGISEYVIGWQIEGKTTDPWLWPDVQD